MPGAGNKGHDGLGCWGRLWHTRMYIQVLTVTLGIPDDIGRNWGRLRPLLLTVDGEKVLLPQESEPWDARQKSHVSALDTPDSGHHVTTSSIVTAMEFSIHAATLNVFVSRSPNGTAGKTPRGQSKRCGSICKLRGEGEKRKEQKEDDEERKTAGGGVRRRAIEVLLTLKEEMNQYLTLAMGTQNMVPVTQTS
ncbi:uncharacterized protein TRIVIDRAFT_203388 [Trichoderma virens Gv29-8]|uniref:Uncharacterized protein n=1 Tax=Hypocrea virens (strain Gv29-8 / FGSC 10586) TaxID=413071 RepID=G9N0C5_HYPVG|nr:uncharacterized protein TRIVIDRAFT_203388 [Trichoderma virens Gv29-8]EHK19807.1 hypothetical protein TRIVIDRAFT_203388 [Trichoderma virens Gv29-8]UKZ53196.1 hypothetical protein TrVGV298_006988 [Trichoderma virens]